MVEGEETDMKQSGWEFYNPLDRESWMPSMILIDIDKMKGKRRGKNNEKIKAGILQRYNSQKH